MWKYKIMIFIMLITTYYFSIQEPLLGDEGLYSIAIKDNIELGLQPTATYFGETMYWKPSLMFNVYAIIASPFYKLVPEEILFRTISLLFVIASLFVLFHFFKNEFNDEKKAYLGIILILITPGFFGFSVRVLTDTIVFLFFGILLYTTQKFEKYNKLFFMLSIIGIGLSKSLVLSILGFMMGIIYYYHKYKKINFEIMILSIISIILILSYSQILGINKLNIGDILRTNNIEINSNLQKYTITTILFYGLSLISLIYFKKDLIYMFTTFFILYLIFNNSIGLPWYIFPILPFISILFLNLNLGKIKELIIILFIWNIIFSYMVFHGLYAGNHNMNKSTMLNLNETIYIGRLGEVIANEIYNYKGVVVTPQNSFPDGKNEQWYGDRTKMTKENLLGLIYDYENPKWWPKYTEDLTIEEKYIPPISRTHKTFDGPFKQIIIEEQYYLLIENVILNDYDLIKIIDEEKTEDKVEQKMYVLSIKEKLE